MAATNIIIAIERDDLRMKNLCFEFIKMFYHDEVEWSRKKAVIIVR
jgi:hypothetical protein